MDAMLFDEVAQEFIGADATRLQKVSDRCLLTDLTSDAVELC